MPHTAAFHHAGWDEGVTAWKWSQHLVSFCHHSIMRKCDDFPAGNDHSCLLRLHPRGCVSWPPYRSTPVVHYLCDRSDATPKSLLCSEELKELIQVKSDCVGYFLSSFPPWGQRGQTESVLSSLCISMLYWIRSFHQIYGAVCFLRGWRGWKGPVEIVPFQFVMQVFLWGL